MGGSPDRNGPCPCGSKRKYKKCCYLKLGKKPLLTPVKLTPSGERITFPELVSLISKSDVAPISLAAMSTDLARRGIASLDFNTEEMVSAWKIGGLALAALANYKPGDNVDLQLQSVPIQKFMHLLRSTLGLQPIQYNKSSDQLLLLIIGLTCLQFSMQGDFVAQVGRVLHIMGVVELNSQTVLSSSPADPLFRRAYGCGAADYAAMQFMIWASGHKQVLFDSSSYFDQSLDRARLSRLLEAILKELSCPVDNVAKILNEDLRGYDGDGLIQRFYSQYPFILLKKNLYLCPPHPFLRANFINGVFFKAIDLAREVKARSVNQELGDRFARYVHFTLQGRCSGDELFEEFSYDKKHDVKSPDSILVDGRDVVLFEAKLKRLKPGTFFAHDIGDVGADCREVAKIIAQPIRFMTLLRKSMDEGRLPKSVYDVSNKILAANRLFIIGVVPLMPSIFHIKLLRDRVESHLAQVLRESPEAEEWYERNKSRIKWHFQDVDEIESYVAIKSDFSFFNLMTQYQSQPWFGFYAHESGGLHPSFRDWVLRTFSPDKKIDSSRGAKTSFETISDYAEALFRGNPER